LSYRDPDRLRRVTMTELSLVEAHERFLEVVDRAEEAKERIYLTRSGKRIAAIVPIEDVEAIEKIEDRIDRRALKRARAEMAVKGTIPWEKVKAELGLE
jgi:prevent-host-death family protein